MNAASPETDRSLPIVDEAGALKALETPGATLHRPRLLDLYSVMVDGKTASRYRVSKDGVYRLERAGLIVRVRTRTYRLAEARP